ncbi:MAG: transglycosylase domain-containing protein [Candidatus Peribacteraceae bacterium]|nr:transglycosylase domain-containing protein [Candidatus Peribacteraceae bacterium]
MRRILVRLAFLSAGIVVLYCGFLWITLPDIADPRSFLASQSTVVLDRNGIELYRFFQEEDRTYVESDVIPKTLKDAIIAIEDERFYERGCLDVRALMRAVIGMGRSGGASTLTRQLARNALDLIHENLVNRKAKELILGCQLESRYTKDELLGLYLNWIPFGQNAYGVEQASHRYFGASVSELSLAQSAILAALPQAPSYFSPYGARRHTRVTLETEQDILRGKITRAADIPDSGVMIGLLGSYVGTGATTLYVGGRTDQVLKNMQEQGMITEQERLAALGEAERIVFQPSRENIRAPHFVLQVRDQVTALFAGTAEEGLLEHGGLTIETTLNWEMQEIAEGVIAFHRDDVFKRFGAHNIALVTLDPATREILTYVGNTDYSDEEFGGKIDMARAPRQPGSSFKPFVYAAAFEKGYNPATVLFDVRTKLGEDEPQNFDGNFWGPLTIRQALGASRNIPAAKGFFLAGGEDPILRLVSSLGAPTPLAEKLDLARTREGGFDYGWPLALGAAETPLIEMTNAYASLADSGAYKPMVSIRRIKDKNGNILYQAELDAVGKQVLDERIAYQLTSILSDESVRPEEYWRTQLSVPGYQTAAKTGTSNKCLEWSENNKTCLLRKPDNAWVLGYTPNLVTGVWIGNADSSAMFEKAGGLNTASPIWRDFFIRAHRLLQNPKTAFTVPDGIVQPQISMLSGQLPTECTPVHLRRADVFLSEHSPREKDPACVTLKIDKVTGLLASDACPEDAQEEGSFFAARSILADRFPTWEEGVQSWMKEQMELWDATETHSGSLLPLPRAPTEACDPSLTPGRLVKPQIQLLSPKDGGIATYPAFVAAIDWEVGSSVREVRFELDGRRVAVETEPPFKPTIRVPRSVQQEGTHTLEVILEDEYFNIAKATATFRFGEDEGAPDVRLLSPTKTTFQEGEEVRIRVEADDAEGAVKYVQFYLNDTLLSTKPKEPFELTYTLDVPAGVYTIRVVAEDMAGHRSEDTLRIAVGNVRLDPLPQPASDDVPEVPSSGGSAAEDPVIMYPDADGITFQRDEVVEFVFRIPALRTAGITQLRAFVVDEQTKTEDLLLRLSDGEGLYRRTWSGKRAGDYTVVLLTENRDSTRTEWMRRAISIR